MVYTYLFLLLPPKHKLQKKSEWKSSLTNRHHYMIHLINNIGYYGDSFIFESPLVKEKPLFGEATRYPHQRTATSQLLDTKPERENLPRVCSLPGEGRFIRVVNHDFFSVVL